jgi:hypothetical protein
MKTSFDVDDGSQSSSYEVREDDHGLLREDSKRGMWVHFLEEKV